ncbi:hypothetical protein Gotur_001172 [Gossypium turneri]
MSGKEISDWTISYGKELEGVEKENLTRTRNFDKWELPHEPFFKINFDGAYDLSMQDLGIRMGIECVIIKGDSLTTIKKSKSDSEDKSEIGAITKNIKQYKENFQQIIFRHISRSANSLAHHLAKESLKKGEDLYLSGGVLDFVRRAKERRRQRTLN